MKIYEVIQQVDDIASIEVLGHASTMNCNDDLCAVKVTDM